MDISKTKLSVAMLNAGIDTSKQLAQLSGISPNTISRIFNGSGAKVSTVRKLAAALGVDVADIIKGE